MISRRELLTGTALSLLATPLLGEAQPSGTVARIGLLNAFVLPSDGEAVWRPFLQALRELGWVEGRNLALESRYAEGKLERLPGLATELVRLRVDVIASGTIPALVAAKQATTSIPIVMVGVLNPVGLGLVQSLARPGGNVTGVSGDVGPEQMGKRIELFKAAVPGTSRMAFLRLLRPGEDAYFEPYMKVAEDSAGRLSLKMQRFDVRAPEDIEGAFAAMRKWRAELLFVGPGLQFLPARRQVVDLAARHRLPAMYVDRRLVDAGGLMCYVASLSDIFRRSAGYVDKILKGTKPADLPVEQPTKMEFVINLKTAKALGLTIPPSVLLQADQVLE